MTHFHIIFVGATILTVCLISNADEAADRKCPINFKYADDPENPVCYLLKGPESFDDTYKDCDGNLFTTALLDILDLPKLHVTLWTDYKTIYPGGPFNNWLYEGDFKTINKDVTYDGSLGLEEDLCVVNDPVNGFNAVRCDEKHSRYCFVKPYTEYPRNASDACTEAGDTGARSYNRFWGPRFTCLGSTPHTLAITFTITKAQSICNGQNGTLLTKGWKYANYYAPALGTWKIPVDVIYKDSHLFWNGIKSDSLEIIPDDEFHFSAVPVRPVYGVVPVIENGNLSFLRDIERFHTVLCERPVRLKHVNLTLSFIAESEVLKLTANDTLDATDIKCFTDTATNFPSEVTFTMLPTDNSFILTPDGDGLYWCRLTNNATLYPYYTTESNKALYIANKNKMLNKYVAMIKYRKRYKIDVKRKVEDLANDIVEDMKEYIYYWNECVRLKLCGSNDSSVREAVIKRMKHQYPNKTMVENFVLSGALLKRMYLDKSSLLIHFKMLSDTLKAPPPGTYDDITVEYVKPLYFCKDPVTPAGVSIMKDGDNFTCVNDGDFNLGVQWIQQTFTNKTRVDVKKHNESSEEALSNGTVTVRPPINIPITVKPTTRPPLTTVTPTTTEYSTTVESNTTLDPSTSAEPTATTEFTTTGESTTTVEPTTTAESTTLSEFTTPAEPTMTAEPSTTAEPCTTESISDPTTTELITTSTDLVATSLPTLESEEHLSDVIYNITQMLNQSDTIPVSNVDHAFEKLDGYLDEHAEVTIPGDVLHLIDKLGTWANLAGQPTAASVKNNVAILMADAGPGFHVRGLVVSARDVNENFAKDDFKIFSNEDTLDFTTNRSEAVIYLPESIYNSTRRISFVVFRNNRAFQRPDQEIATNSLIFSIRVENVTQFDDNESIDIHMRPLQEKLERNQTASCGYWHFEDNDRGSWSQEGCEFIRASDEDELDICRCNHLTHFAQILMPKAVFSEIDEYILEFIAIIGCCLSIIGIIIVGLTAVLFRSWRKEFTNKIWLQLCIAILLLAVCFLIVVFARFDRYNVPCMLTGAALHYCVLVSFCWMLVAAVLSYRRLVLVFTRDLSHKLLKAAAFAWGAPCAVIGILLSISPLSYQGQFDEKFPSGTFCYPSGLSKYLTVYAPIVLMLLINWSLFFIIVWSVFIKRKGPERHCVAKETVRCASVSCLLVFLFGLPWIFGLFNNVVTAYLFNITSAFQGFFLFSFFIIGNRKTRDQWLNLLKIKKTRRIPVTSSTYTNKSTGQGGRPGPVLLEARTSKPKSLTSPDNSRFS